MKNKTIPLSEQFQTTIERKTQRDKIDISNTQIHDMTAHFPGLISLTQIHDMTAHFPGLISLTQIHDRSLSWLDIPNTNT